MTTRSVAFMPTDLEALAHAVGVLDGGPRDQDLTDPVRSKK